MVLSKERVADLYIKVLNWDDSTCETIDIDMPDEQWELLSSTAEEYGLLPGRFAEMLILDWFERLTDKDKQELDTSD